MKFIIPILVGAVIGYITNWLAIKMLFRPHYEKRFLGFKIPFTPGLIPKERERIAKSVGETVGKHLLTPEVLVEALCSERIGTQIKSMLEKKIIDLSESDLSIIDILARVAEGKEDEIVKKAEGAIQGIILAQVQRPEVGERIKVFIEEKIRTGLKSCRTSEFYRDLRDEVLGNLRQFAYSRELDLLMTDIINRKVGELRGDSRTLREVIPEEFIQSVRVYLYNNKDKVIQFIREEIQNPSIKEKLKAAIGGMVEENLGKLITIFISPDTIGIKILDAIEKYMYKPDSAENIAYILINSFDRIISGEVRDISPYFTPDNTAKLSLEVSNLLRGLAEKEQSIEKLILLFEERFELSQEKLWEVINYNMRNYIESLINGEELGFFIGELVHNSISDWLVKQKLSSFLGGMKPKTIEEISNAVRVLYEEFVRNKASQVAELIDIEDIVEERINSFDVAFAEEIILDVANKELKAITWLGALLGAVMGILSPLIELMTR